MISEKCISRKTEIRKATSRLALSSHKSYWLPMMTIHFYQQLLLYLNHIAQIHNKKIIRSSSLCVKSLLGDRVSPGKVIPASRTLAISRVKLYCPFKEISVRTCANIARCDILLLLTLSWMRRLIPSRLPCSSFKIYLNCCCYTNYPVWNISYLQSKHKMKYSKHMCVQRNTNRYVF